MQWNDARFFLAVHRAGSYSGATKELGVDATTVARRVARLEDELGVELFRRTGTGLELTLPGSAILEPAEQMERAALSLAMSASAAHDDPGGRVRLGSTDAFAIATLVPLLARYHQLHGESLVELCSSESLMDLGRAGLDMAIRFGVPGKGVPLAQGATELVRRKIGLVPIGLFASRSYLKERGTPANEKDLLDHHFIVPSPSARYIPGYRWGYETIAAGATVSMYTDKIVTCAEGAVAGMGITLLPTFFDEHYELEPVLPDLEVDRRVAWLVVPKEMRRVRRIRELSRFLLDELGALLH